MYSSRLEADFSGSKGYRIRHAYASFGNILIGQTWSLFSNVSTAPITVDSDGPAGIAGIRTPQVRYRMPLDRRTNLYVALEYSEADVEMVDSIRLELLDLHPDLTFRLDRDLDFGKLQLSGLLTTLAAKDSTKKIRSSLVAGVGFVRECKDGAKRESGFPGGLWQCDRPLCSGF